MKDLAAMAIRLNLFPELREKAELRALQADARKHFNEFDDEGNPGAVAFQELVLDEEGNEVRVDSWIQTDMCELEHWEFNIRAKFRGTRDDAKKIRKLARWGMRQFKGAKKAFAKIQDEFGFALDDVAGPEDEAESPLA